MTYTDNKGVKRDSNSSLNQSIKDKFVSNHVYANVGTMVHYILSKSYEDDKEAPFTYDDCENMEVYVNTFNGEYLKTEEEVQQEIEALEDLQLKEGERESVTEVIKGWKDFEREYVEAYEWWIVSSFFLGKLQDRKKVTIDHESIWGRCTTGQQISIDHIIDEICFDMEILEGQENEWSI